MDPPTPPQDSSHPPGSPPPAPLPPSLSPTPDTPPLQQQSPSASSPVITTAPATEHELQAKPDTPPQAASSPGASSSEPAMYESPSPPSTASSGPDYDSVPVQTSTYGSIVRRRRAGAATISNTGDADSPTGGTTVVSLANDAALGSISPIARRADLPSSIPYSDLPDENPPDAPTSGSTGWQASSYVPVLPADETTALLHDVDAESLTASASELLSRSRADLERARLASTREYSRRELREGMKDRYIFGCSVLVMTSVVFVIVVSGMTTILANRNYPQLEVYSDWPNGGIIPLKYGCHAPDGKPVSIPLHWRNVPRQATNLAVLFAHPGAITSQGFDPVHWFITDIPLGSEKDGSIPVNASSNPDLMPDGAKQHANAGSDNGVYWPPCISNGTSFFVVHVYAIEASPTIDDFRDAREIINRFVGVPVARITGLYGKPKKLVIPDKKKHKQKGAHEGEGTSEVSEHH